MNPPPSTLPAPVQHRISAGAIVVRDGRVLMVRHCKPGAYDFWVCPGGGVQGAETLEQAAAREALEETGLHVQVGRLAYIEEFFSPETRFVKFWFLAECPECTAGTLDISHPDTVGEHIVEAAWRTPHDLQSGPVFPEFLPQRLFDDLQRGWTESPVRVPLRAMAFW